MNSIPTEIEHGVVCWKLEDRTSREIAQLMCVCKQWNFWVCSDIVRIHSETLQKMLNSTLLHERRPSFRLCLHYHHSKMDITFSDIQTQYVCGICRQSKSRGIGVRCLPCQKEQCIGKNRRGKRCRKKMKYGSYCTWHKTDE